MKSRPNDTYRNAAESGIEIEMGRHQCRKIKPFYDYCNGRSDDALVINLIQNVTMNDELNKREKEKKNTSQEQNPQTTPESPLAKTI